MTPIAIDLLMEEPQRFKAILTPLTARIFLTRFEVKGERIGFLVNKHGVETKLSEASDAQLLAAASAILASLSKQAKVDGNVDNISDLVCTTNRESVHTP